MKMMKAFKKRGALTHFQILSEISKLGNCGNQESQEIKIYFDFLYKNKIIQ